MHELTHIALILALYPFVTVEYVHFTTKPIISLFIYFNSKHKAVKIIIITAPFTLSIASYIIFLWICPAVSLIVLYGLAYSNLNLSETDIQSLDKTITK